MRTISSTVSLGESNYVSDSPGITQLTSGGSSDRSFEDGRDVSNAALTNAAEDWAKVLTVEEAMRYLRHSNVYRRLAEFLDFNLACSLLTAACNRYQGPVLAGAIAEAELSELADDEDDLA